MLCFCCALFCYGYVMSSTSSDSYSWNNASGWHNCDIIMSVMASNITGISIVYSAVCSGADQRKHQTSTSLAFVWGIHQWQVNSPHKGTVTWKVFPFDDIIMRCFILYNGWPCICCCQGSFYHGNGSILTLWSWLNDEKQLIWCKFSYVNNHLYSVINFNHVKLRYIEPCNFLTKRAFVRQQSTLAVAKDPNILHYLNLLIYLPAIILAIT